MVHIVDMSQSNYNTPSSQSPRKRRSSEDIENVRPSKDRPSKQPLPSSENEINYISVSFNAKKTLKYTPDHVRPVAMVSPISQSMQSAPQDVKVRILFQNYFISKLDSIIFYLIY